MAMRAFSLAEHGVPLMPRERHFAPSLRGSTPESGTILRSEGILPSIGPLECAVPREVRNSFHGSSRPGTRGID